MSFRGPLSNVAAITSLFFALLGCATSHHRSTSSATQQNGRVSGEANPFPGYPSEALKNGWGGKVILEVLVGTNCRPSTVGVVQSSGHGILDDAAKKCVERWTFRPDQIGSNTVPITFTIPK